MASWSSRRPPSGGLLAPSTCGRLLCYFGGSSRSTSEPAPPSGGRMAWRGRQSELGVGEEEEEEVKRGLGGEGGGWGGEREREGGGF